MECNPKEIRDRMHRLQGQLVAIEKMYDEKRDWQEVLQQIIAARASLASLARFIIEAEAKGCLPGGEEIRPLARIVDTLFKVT